MDFLMLFIVVGGVFALVMSAVINFDDMEPHHWVAWGAGLVLEIGLVVWLILAANNSNVLAEEIFPLSTIDYPDGTKEQIIVIDVNHKLSMTDYFRIMLPEGSKIRQTTYSHWSYGMYRVVNPDKPKYEVVK